MKRFLVVAILGQDSSVVGSFAGCTVRMCITLYETHIFRKHINTKPKIKLKSVWCTIICLGAVNVGQLRHIPRHGMWHDLPEMMALHVQQRAVRQSWSTQAQYDDDDDDGDDDDDDDEDDDADADDDEEEEEDGDDTVGPKEMFSNLQTGGNDANDHPQSRAEAKVTQQHKWLVAPSL